LNTRLQARHTLGGGGPCFSPRPVPTKYTVLPVLDTTPASKVPLTYNVAAADVDVESSLKNITFALQRDSRAVYIPASSSDLYNRQPLKSSNAGPQPHPLLFASVVSQHRIPHDFPDKATAVFNNVSLR
jgi:hypothetical protein